VVFNIKVCPKGNRLNQLTFEEVQLMRHYVTSDEFSYFPIRSLHYYAKRQGTLFCSYSTWTKYIDQYKWLRPRKIPVEKPERVGIRAKRPNEIWHMDVSHFILPNGKTCYIQAIIDNYSRYVLTWQVLESYDGSKTAVLLKRALAKVNISGPGLSVMVDSGGENKSHVVNDLEAQGHFTKVVAQFEISFSNSIVEALFRQLKNNYLYHKNIYTHKSLSRHTNFWFNKHNEVIPHTAFTGETPLERFSQSRDKEEEIRILVRHEDAIKLRIKNNQKIFCQMCAVA
jgi:putative transposase